MPLEWLLFWALVASFSAWLIAEFRGSRLWRLLFGTAAMVMAASLTPSFPQRDLVTYQGALGLMNQTLEAGDAVAIICLVLVLAILKIVAGARNYRRHNRGLGILALAVGPLSVLTFFCLPSALAIMVYGLVVYCHHDVKRAFAEAEQTHE
jgi:hypothetical protein